MIKKILIVDDEPDLREMLKDFFERDNFDVTQASGGNEAFELIKNQKFDCVLSDIRMPLGSGIELAQNIKNLKNPKPFVVLITGFTEVPAHTIAELEVVKVFQKPFSPDELVSFINMQLMK